MSEVWTGVITALAGMLTVFVILGVLTGSVSLLGRWASGAVGGRSGWASEAVLSPEEERELVALFSAIRVYRPGARPVPGIYALRVNGRERKLRLVELGPGRALLELEDERQLEVRLESPERQVG
ncbi:MAG: OadG family protein [Bacillota bacterium]